MKKGHITVTVAIAFATFGCKPQTATRDKSIEALQAGGTSTKTILRPELCDSTQNTVDPSDFSKNVRVDGFDQYPKALEDARAGYTSALKTIPPALITMFTGGTLAVVEKYDGVGCANPPTTLATKDSAAVLGTEATNPRLSSCWNVEKTQPGATGASATPVIQLFSNDSVTDATSMQRLIHGLLTVELMSLYDQWFTPMAKSVTAPSSDPDEIKKVEAIKKGVEKYEAFRVALAKAFVEEVKAGADSTLSDTASDKAEATDLKDKLAAMRENLSKVFGDKPVAEFVKLADDPAFQRFVLAQTVDSESCSKLTKNSYKKILKKTDEFYNKAENGNPFLLK